MGTLTLAIFVALVSSLICIGCQYMEILDLNDYVKHWLIPILNTYTFGSFGVGLTSYFTSSTNSQTAVDIFTKEELSSYKYKYLAIAGEVFDVSKGDRHYGKEGGYNFFTGVDGTRAFVSGIFTDEGLIDDIDGLDAASIQSIEDWRLKYHKDYKYLGKLVGNFYDSNGEETESKKKYKQLLIEAEKAKLKEKELKALYPPCNAEFSNRGSRVWCANMSGGISRSWVGVPRKMFVAGGKDFRCACIRTTGPPTSNMNSKSHNNRGDLDNPNLREYKECDSASPSCPILP